MKLGIGFRAKCACETSGHSAPNKTANAEVAAKRRRFNITVAILARTPDEQDWRLDCSGERPPTMALRAGISLGSWKRDEKVPKRAVPIGAFPINCAGKCDSGFPALVVETNINSGQLPLVGRDKDAYPMQSVGDRFREERLQLFGESSVDRIRYLARAVADNGSVANTP